MPKPKVDTKKLVNLFDDWCVDGGATSIQGELSHIAAGYHSATVMGVRCNLAMSSLSYGYLFPVEQMKGLEEVVTTSMASDLREYWTGHYELKSGVLCDLVFWIWKGTPIAYSLVRSKLTTNEDLGVEVTVLNMPQYKECYASIIKILFDFSPLEQIVTDVTNY